MRDEDEEQTLPSRRSILTHLAAVVSGWLLGTFLDPLRRSVNRLVANTPFGRRAQVTFGYASHPDPEKDGYMVQIGNTGGETAENLSAHIAFNEAITGYEIEDWANTPPLPSTHVEIVDDGVAKIQIESVRRDFYEHFNPQQIIFTVDEESESSLAFRVDEDETMFVAYQYSWTFLGERYYESTDHHIA